MSLGGHPKPGKDAIVSHYMYKYPVPLLDPLLAALQTTMDGLPAKTIHVLEAKSGLDVPMCLSSSIMN